MLELGRPLASVLSKGSSTEFYYNMLGHVSNSTLPWVISFTDAEVENGLTTPGPIDYVKDEMGEDLAT